jgi:CheY-like chemotaxis protein
MPVAGRPPRGEAGLTSEQQAAVDTLLVVDDDPVNVQMVVRILDKSGYATFTAADGEECLRQARAHGPDLILLDISMPNMDGLAACRALKADEKTAHIPIIFVTAQSGEEVLEEAFEAGAADYVHKPIRQVELRVRIEAALAQVAAARRRAEKETLKAVLETAGGVCHELNQPLQAVMGAVQLQLMDVDPSLPLHAALSEIDEHVRRMGEITRKLMKITRYRTRPYLDGIQILDLEGSTENSPKK